VSRLYVFYPLGDIVQCPVALVPWPGHIHPSDLPDVVLPLLRDGADVEISRLGAKVWGVYKQGNT
jgi:hypothetical protein